MEDLGLRSLLLIGGSSYAITLPKDWIRRRRITERTKVRLLEGPSGELIVTIAGFEVVSRAKIRFKEFKDGIWGIIAAYLDGYDEIEIETEGIKGEDFRALKKALSKLMGMEILEENSRRILIKCLMDHSSANPMELLLRMKSIISGMMSDLRDAIIRSDTENLSLIVERDDEVDRIYFALVRQVRKAMRSPEIMGSLKISPIELLDLRIAAMMLELIADSITELAMSGEFVDKLPDFLERASVLFSLAFKSFESKDFGKAVEVREEVEEILELISESDGRIGIPLINLLVRIGDLCDLVSPRF